MFAGAGRNLTTCQKIGKKIVTKVRYRQTDRQTDSATEKGWNIGESLPELRSTVLQQRSQEKSDRAVCPFPSHGVMFCRSWGKQFPLEQYIRADFPGGGDSWNRPFPSQFARFCTAWNKQRPIEQYTRQSIPDNKSEILHWRRQEQCDARAGAEREQNGGRLGVVTILMCSGERREESSKRATYPEWSIHEALTTKKRRVYRWRPMLDYKTADIWSMVKDSGIDPHEAYLLGCDRLGCTMCIFAGECGRMAKDVKIACANNPEQYEELDKLETDTGYTMSISGVRVRDIVKKA